MKRRLLMLAFIQLACSHGCGGAKKKPPAHAASANPPVPPRRPLPCVRDSGTPAGSAISLSLKANRMRGVAPLSVFFETNGTTAQASSRPLHDLGYCWDFGDPDAGLYSTTGLEKNQARGPVAGHVFEKPGRYEVTLSARDRTGRVATQSLQVTIDDPEQVFSGTATVCFSPDGDFARCPAGAEQVTTSRISDLARYVAPGRRLLLARGGSFTGNLNINVQGPGIVGAYGSPSAPRPHVTTGANAFQFSAQDPNFADWRIMDVEVSGSSESSAVVYVGGLAYDLLLLRVKGSNIGSGVGAPDSVINYWNANGHPGHDVIDGLTIADCEMRDLIGGAGHNLSYIAAHRLLMLGNLYQNSTNGEHILRTPWIDRGVISDNDLGGAPAPRHLLKMHAPKFTEAGVGQGKCTEQVVISDNVFRCTGGHQWSLALGPQNEGSDERVRDVIVERNLFLPGPSARLALVVWGTGVTVRDNLFNRGSQGACMSFGTRGVEPHPDMIVVSHNTCYTDAANVLIAGADSTVTNASAYNNLGVSTSGSGSGVSGTFTEAGNLVTNGPHFANGALAQWQDFALAEGSPAIDAADNQHATPWDYSGHPRPIDGSGTARADVGALERNP